MRLNSNRLQILSNSQQKKYEYTQPYEIRLFIKKKFAQCIYDLYATQTFENYKKVEIKKNQYISNCMIWLI